MPTRARYVAGVQTFYEDAYFETVQKMSPVQYYDDFLGAGSLVIPAAGSTENGVDWAKKIVGAGPPTVAGVASAVGGQISIALTATSEKQDAVLYWADQKGLDITKGLVFETRINLSTLPSVAGVEMVAGVHSNWIDGPDNNTCYARFQANGNGVLNFQSYDGVTTVSKSASKTLTTSDWAILRIDASNIADVKFSVNGVQVSATGDVNFAATGTLAVLQPYVSMYKASGTGVGTALVDYVKAWANRA